MIRSVTAPISFLTVLCLFLVVSAGSAAAQDEKPVMGDDFIFFVNGPNVLIPRNESETVADPDNASNLVAQFNYGDWNQAGFGWTTTEGIDATSFVGDAWGESDTLYLRLRVDTANARQANTWLLFADKTDGSGATRTDIENGDAEADHEFRLIWSIPDEMQDGEWHDLVIPLPPATLAALDSAKAGVKVDGTPLDTPMDDMAMLWSYTGSWAVGGFGIGPGFGTDPTTDLLWREFEWDSVHEFGVFWDTNAGGGPIWIDDMYIGGPGTDVSAASGAPAAMSGVSFTTDGTTNVVSWTPNPDFGAYSVYVSESAFTDPLAEGVLKLATLPFDAESFEVRHDPRAPHPSLAAEATYYYAVTSASLFGVENFDVSGSSSPITNSLISEPFILQLTEDEGNTLFDNLSAGTVTPEGFPGSVGGYEPFVIDGDHSSPGDAPLPPDDDDFSATVWLAYSDLNELWIYAEIRDDVLELPGENRPNGDAWQNDSFEMGWGGYEVPAGLFGGSDHNDMLRGEAPDYQFRVATRVDGAGNIVESDVGVWQTGADGDGIIQGSGAVAEKWMDGETVIGYKFLALVPLDAIQNTAQGDVVFPAPGADEIALIPGTLVYNDADGSGREHQAGWTIDPGFGGGWWNTPAQWSTLAMAGRNVPIPTDVEDEAAGGLPFRYALNQNYPNPFNGATTIDFSLAEAGSVKLDVYNVLGQRVATVLDGDVMPAGRHTVQLNVDNLASGLYLYRLEAGPSFTKTRRMLLVK